MNSEHRSSGAESHSIVSLLAEVASQPLNVRSLRMLFRALGLPGNDASALAELQRFPAASVECAFAKHLKVLTSVLKDQKCASTLLLAILRIGVARSLLVLIKAHFKTTPLSQGAEFRLVTFLAELEASEALIGACCETVELGGAVSQVSAAKLHKCARGTLETLSGLLVFLDDEHKFLSSCPAACEYLAQAQVELQKLSAAHADGRRVTELLAGHLGLLPS